jgi:two-component system response regulator HydG
MLQGAQTTMASAAGHRPLLLVVDDDTAILDPIARFAERAGFDVMSCRGGREALAQLQHRPADLAVVDLRMPDVNGLEVLRAIRETVPGCGVILMTGAATIDSAVEAIKLGAIDYFTKPLDFDRFSSVLATVREEVDRRQCLLATEGDLALRLELCGMMGRSPQMQETFMLIRRLAPHVRTVLITGETGTGKELVARALHRMGPRHDRRFIIVNCSAVVETLFESELFGHARGAFTGAVEAKVGPFELADAGTLFLDEVGELPLPVQAKLLRVLECGEVQRVGATDGRRVDVRAIAATNRRLADEVAAGRFRQDLYYRLNVVEIGLPPLRERREDIPYLSAAFIKEFAKRFNKPLTGLSPGAERLLQNAPWSGNIRELRNVLERTCMLSDGRILSEREVLAALGAGQHATPAPVATGASTAPQPPRPIPELDRKTVEQALQQVGGNRSAAARLLGISRRALYRRLDALGLR